MGSLKDEALQNETEDVKAFTLTDSEMAYIKLLNMSLQFHTYANQIRAGFLYYVATQRLGYTDGTVLQFEVDPEKKEDNLIIKVLPADTPMPGQAAAPAQ